MRRHHVVSTSVQRHFNVVCLLNGLSLVLIFAFFCVVFMGCLSHLVFRAGAFSPSLRGGEQVEKRRVWCLPFLLRVNLGSRFINGSSHRRMKQPVATQNEGNKTIQLGPIQLSTKPTTWKKQRSESKQHKVVITS